MFVLRRGRLLAACLLVLAPLALAAGAETVLRVGSPWAPKTLDIQKYGYLFARLGVTESLVGVDEKVKLVPCLAESWKVSDDRLTWTFAIRPGVRFHDGSLLTAALALESLKRLQDSGTLLKTVPIAAIEAPDAATLVVRTSQPFAPLAAYLSKGEAAIVSPASFDATGAMVKPIGTGPFVFDSWKVQDEVVTTANPQYWAGTRAKVDRVVYKGVPEAMTRLTMLRAGELDIAQILPADAAKAVALDPAFRLQTREIGRTRLIGFNLTRTPFDDPRLRRAASLAIDRAAIVTHLLDGVGRPASSLFPPDFSWADAKLTVPPHDPEAAKKLLEEAGWKDSDGNGVREKDGKPLAVKLVTYPERAELPPIAEVVQSGLAAVGVKVELIVLPVSASEETRRRGEFDMYLVGRGLMFVPDPDENLMLDYFSESNDKAGLGAFHWKSAALDDCLAKARTEFDPAKRKALYDQVQEVIMAELPVLYLNYYVNVDLVSDKVRGYRMHPVEQSFQLETVELAK